MKTTHKVIALVMMCTAASQAATTISGIVGGNFKAVDNATNITTGSLVMLVADVGGNGFLNLSAQGALTPSTTAQLSHTLTGSQAGLTAGSLFGGDTIVTTSSSGAGSIGGILTGIDISSFVNLNFAIVYFNNGATALNSGNIAGQTFGMLRLADWTFPAADAGATFTFSATDAGGATSFYSTSASTTATQLGGGFFSGTGVAADVASTAVRSTNFSVVVVPEPSAALLGTIGALGLLRRRRN